ncbi:leucine-rich repeat protein [Eubacterium uniforme]|nr:leucine-rich repeat protein [Eubacterium uniforme]
MEKKPAVKADGLVEGKDYIVAYSNNVNPGTAKVTITGKGDFSGKKEFSFVINMKKGDFSEVGITIKDKNYIYKVTKTGNKFGEVGEVKVIGLKKKSLKKINIATKVTIGGIKYKVTSIGVKAFKGNKKIIKLTIGKNVKTIGAYAFANCKKLKKVTINTKKLKKVGKKAFFRKGGKNISFKVPKSKKKAYKKLLKKAKTNKYVVK